MDIELALRVLQSAGGDPVQLCLVTVDLAFPNRDESGRSRLKEALLVVSIPHWFNDQIVAKLLNTDLEEAQILVSDLSRLSIIESFHARGSSAYNVHEKTRKLLRDYLHSNKIDRFHELSSRSADHFIIDKSAYSRVEWIYQRLSTGDETAVDELELLDQQLTDDGYPENRLALAGVLQELEDAKILEGSMRAMALCAIEFIRNNRGDSSRVEKNATLALKLARESGRGSIVGQCLCLLGDFKRSHGQIDHALALYKEALSLGQSRVEKDPECTKRQLALAVAYSRVGDVFEIQGKLALALEAYEENKRITCGLISRDSQNRALLRNLGVAYSKVGDVLKSQGRLDLAKSAYEDYLVVFRSLIEIDPNNAEWQHGMGIAYSKNGDIHAAVGQYKLALIEYENALGIAQKLVSQDPDDATLQRELAVENAKVGDALVYLGEPERSLKYFDNYLEISERLTALDSENADWQFELSIGHSIYGDALRRQGKYLPALKEYEKHYSVSKRLAELDQNNSQCQRHSALALERIGSLHAENGRLKLGRDALRLAVDIMKLLVERCPEVPSWKDELLRMRRRHTKLTIARIR